MSRAVYPGSFDPITQGHVDIIERASKIFSELIVLVAVNEDKHPLFSVRKREELIQEAIAHLPNVGVDAMTDRLLVEYLKERNIRILVKGLRAMTDFDYEFQMALMNKKLYPEVETVFLVTKAEHAFLSSSIVKEIARLGGNVEHLVPPGVEAALRQAYGEEVKG